MKDYRKSKKSHDDLNKIKVPNGLQEKQDAKRPTVRNDVKLPNKAREQRAANTLTTGKSRVARPCLLVRKQSSHSYNSRYTFALNVSTLPIWVFTLGPADPAFCEKTPYAPNSPYSASKAGADHLVRSYFHTYGFPVLTTNCSNNYGPFQFPEKLIPLMILNACEGKSLPIYGDGGNIRDWLHVEDHCSGILAVLNKGRLGETYCIGGNSEKTNLEIVDFICTLLDERLPEKAPHDQLKTFVKDRPGHDRRYAIDCSKIKQELGWEPRYSFEEGIAQTVDWYLDNSIWCENVTSGNYQRERLGIS